MDKISIKLNQDYKQFKKDFTIDLNGSLIIISGVNGTGKTQLIDILSRSQVFSPTVSRIDLAKYAINSDVKINDCHIPKVLVSRRSFKDNIKINNTILPDPKNVLWHKDEAWKYYSDYHKWNDNTVNYLKSKSIVMECIKGHTLVDEPKFDASKPNNTRTGITEEEFKSLLPNDFVWEQDDLFANSIDRLFYEFAAKRHDEQARLGRENGGFNNDDYLKNAPWTFLNDLFEKLNFNYRFKIDYEFVTPNLKERPMLFPILSDGSLDYESPRELSELSDGEKSIISLTFALLNENRRPIEKILLLDEFDNTLNPSLIESLFTILNDYFVSRGVVVVMTTHSPVTISLAPDYARCYEVFKQDNDSPKIIPVDKFQYTELKIANKSFYDKLENQNERIKELEKEIKVFDSQKILFVEDKYVNIYKLGWLKIHGINPTVDNIEDEFSNHAIFEIYSKGNKDNLRGFLANPYMEEWKEKNIVGLFDFDDAYDTFKVLTSSKDRESKWDNVVGDDKTGLYSRRSKYNNVFVLMLPVPEFRESIASKDQTTNKLEVELLFKDEDIQAMYGGNEYSVEKVIGNLEIPKIKNKKDFWKKAIALPKEKFEGFVPLFNAVNSLLDIDEDGEIDNKEGENNE